MSNPLVSKAILRFFEELNKFGIRYAVLRKVELIPENIGNDIDILINEREKSSVLKVIRDCAEKFGFKIYERKDVKGLYAILYTFVQESNVNSQMSNVIFFRLDFTNPVKNPDALLNARIRNEKGIYYLPAGLYEKRKKSNLKNFLSYPKRFLFPPGKFVVIVGPDGVGKSTTAELASQILEAFHIPVKHMHLGFRPKILPTKKELMSFGKKKPIQGEESNVPGLIRFFYHALDYILGYFLKVRPFLVRGRIVLGERYYYSYLVDPRKQRELKFPSWLPRYVFNFFVPKPNVVILLSNNPEEIFKRKQEHSIQEIGRQIAAYGKIGRRAKRFFEVKTDKPINEAAMEIVNKLISEN